MKTGDLSRLIDTNSNPTKPNNFVRFDENGEITTVAPVIFIAVFNTTLYSKVKEMYDNGRILFCNRDGLMYQFLKKQNDEYSFYCLDGATFRRCVLHSDGSWGYDAKNFEVIS